MAKSKNGPAAQVRNIPVSEIGPNPHNPRRLFDAEPMEILEASIKQLGILVPITVYQPSSKATGPRYVILDGERRWRCAIDLKLSHIPAIVVSEPDETQNILTMFHIHNVREGWQLMPTALKLQVLMKTLRTTNERELAALTKLSVSQVRRCKTLLTFPKSFQNMMLAPPSERMKADFFIELQRMRGPAQKELAPWVTRGDAHCVQIILDKYLEGTIQSVTEFRKLAELYRGSQRIGKGARFAKLFDRFLDDPEMTIDELAIPGANFEKEAKEIGRSAKRLTTQLISLGDLEDIASDEAVVQLLIELRNLLEKKLEGALLVR